MSITSLGSPPPISPIGPLSSGDTPLPLWNALNPLWSMFHQVENDKAEPLSVVSTPHFWAMFSDAINGLMAQFNPVPTDKKSLAIYNDLTKPLITVGGVPYSLANFCTEAAPQRDIDLASNYSQGEKIISLCLYGDGSKSNPGLLKDVDSWYSVNPKPKVPPPSAAFSGYFASFKTDLKKFVGTSPTDPNYYPDLKAVVEDIWDLQQALSPPQDGYEQLMLNFLTAPITENGPSLYSLANAIHTGGYGPGDKPIDTADTVTFENVLTKPQSLPSPFVDAPSLYDDFIKWIQPIIDKYEFSG